MRAHTVPLPPTDSDDTFYGIIGIGGLPCLDFVNTHEWRGTSKSIERFRRSEDIVHWARCAGIITPAQATDLTCGVREQPEKAAAFLVRTLSYREALFSCLSQIATSGAVGATTLEPVNLHLSTLLGRLELATIANELGNTNIRLTPSDSSLTSILVNVTWSLIDLLRGNQLQDLKQCAGPHCQWLFIDCTKNKRRRWCAMSICGSRVKSASFKARKRSIKTQRVAPS